MTRSSTVRQFTSLAVPLADDLIFGTASRPVHCGFDLVIGGGLVYPEVNFTLPPLEITAANWPRILAEYDEMATSILRRAVALQVPGIVLEFELLPAMTEVPEWGAEITAVLHKKLADAHEKRGLRSALRVTPTDVREHGKPPLMRTGRNVEALLRCFRMCAEAGADILSIESIGGKEVHDRALMYGDTRGIAFALGVLAPRDMAWLWDRIGEICGETGAIPGGDTACGFANTAMQLANQRMLPEVLAAIIRAMSAVRSLVAFEHGAVGPSKDCAYEGPVVKAIAGCPISMEGKSSACAHFSPVGNVAAAMCDLWSNESVQNVRLLSGSAPEAFTEMLAYDCRLMNEATASGSAKTLRNLLSKSDCDLSPQAALLTPDATVRIADAIVSESDVYTRTVAAGTTAIAILREKLDAGTLKLSKKELQWLGRLEADLTALPADEAMLTSAVAGEYGGLFDAASYGLQPATVLV